MNVMRFTIIDSRGAISFVAECDVLLPMVAACQDSPRTLRSLLDHLGRFRPRVRDYVESGLAVFDEHNVPGTPRPPIHEAIDYLPADEMPVFRVIDDRTRQVSLEGVKAGIVIFNLVDRRIVQVQNTYTEVRRKGKIAVRGGGRGTQIVRYELPPDWAIVP